MHCPGEGYNMTTTINISEQITNTVIAQIAQSVKSSTQELMFFMAVQSAMSELDGKPITRRIIAKVRDILGWKDAVIYFGDNDNELSTWTISTWGGESGRAYDEKIVAYLGCRGFNGQAPEVHSTKRVRFAAWRETTCFVARTQRNIDRFLNISLADINGLVDAQIVLADARAAWKDIADDSPISHMVEETAKRMI